MPRPKPRGSRRKAQRRKARQRRKELERQQGRDKFLDDKVEVELQRHRQQLMKTDGFLADTSKSLWENIDSYYRGMDLQHYITNLYTNKTCHIIGNSGNKVPAGIGHLLGLGSKFCPKRTKQTNKPIDDNIERLKADIRTKFMFRLTPEGDYIQGMYIRAPDFKPEPASDEIEQCLQDYEAAIRAERRRILRRHKRNPPIPNLTVLQQSLMTQLRGVNINTR